MTNRREFLQTAVGLSALPMAAGAAHASSAPTLQPQIIVADARFAQARAVSDQLAKNGVAARTIANADITALWRDTLKAAWTETRAPVAGLTARPALFCLEELARDHRMRVAFLAEHELRSDGSARHVLVRGAGDMSRLEAAGADWASALARTLAEQPLPRAAAGPSGASLERVAGSDERMLVSWIIAPVA